MSNIIIDLLQKQISDQVLGSLGKNLNVQDQGQISNASQSAINVLLNALTKNAGKGEGLNALMGALDKDHDGSILDDVMGYVNGSMQNQNPRTTNGAGILSHVLGDKMGSVVESISKQNGLNSNQASSLLEKLAPLVLGSIGKARKTQQVDQRGLYDLLENSAETYNRPRQDDSILTNLLDRDGDGNIMDEVAGMGMKVLGNLFKK